MPSTVPMSLPPSCSAAACVGHPTRRAVWSRKSTVAALSPMRRQGAPAAGYPSPKGVNVAGHGMVRAAGPATAAGRWTHEDSVSVAPSADAVNVPYGCMGRPLPPTSSPMVLLSPSLIRFQTILALFYISCQDGAMQCGQSARRGRLRGIAGALTGGHTHRFGCILRLMATGRRVTVWQSGTAGVTIRGFFAPTDAKSATLSVCNDPRTCSPSTMISGQHYF